MIFYQGRVSEVVAHFGKLGFPCPANYNPSDFVMTLSQTLTLDDCIDKNILMKAPPELHSEDAVSTKFNEEIVFKSESSFFKQISALSYREIINTKRDVSSLMMRFGSTIFLNLLFGLIFMNAGGRDNGNITDFNSHFGAITMVLISSMFGSAQPVMLSFPFERPMFLREYTSGTCKWHVISTWSSMYVVLY